MADLNADFCSGKRHLIGLSGTNFSAIEGGPKVITQAKRLLDRSIYNVIG
jgi:hypothetical protein